MAIIRQTVPVLSVFVSYSIVQYVMTMWVCFQLLMPEKKLDLKLPANTKMASVTLEVHANFLTFIFNQSDEESLLFCLHKGLSSLRSLSDMNSPEPTWYISPYLSQKSLFSGAQIFPVFLVHPTHANYFQHGSTQ